MPRNQSHFYIKVDHLCLPRCPTPREKQIIIFPLYDLLAHYKKKLIINFKLKAYYALVSIRQVCDIVSLKKFSYLCYIDVLISHCP